MIKMSLMYTHGPLYSFRIVTFVLGDMLGMFSLIYKMLKAGVTPLYSFGIVIFALRGYAGYIWFGLRDVEMPTLSLNCLSLN